MREDIMVYVALGRDEELVREEGGKQVRVDGQRGHLSVSWN